MNKFFILALLAIGVSCSSKTETKVKVIEPQVQPRVMGELKIAYYNSDSLKTGFTYFKNEEAIVTKQQAAFEKEVQKRTKAYQAFIMQSNENLKKGLLSENEQMQLQQKAQQMESSLMQYQQQEGARLEKLTVTKLEAISKKIESFGKDFSKANQIDVLLIHGPGGQINFIDESMNVTAAFISYLNAHQADIEKALKK
jgi:Skp family chaperone for outer membrane proteins